ncbi:MAG TPA: O-antigen ligase family protein [Thermoanaerobaculia bacterium]|nr:O-antigen ligase family protein [Thermoanaerobaculia bacterium]
MKSRVAHLLWFAVLLTIAITPLLVSPAAKNAYRLPKTLFFQSMMLLVAASILAWHLLGGSLARYERHRLPLVLAAAAFVWTIVTSAFAMQREVTASAWLTVLCSGVLVVATIGFARRAVAPPFIALFAPAAINAFVGMLQGLHLWTPIALDRMPKGRLAVMGLLGNPDYVGAYLMVPAIAAIAAAIAFTQHRRIFAGVAIVLLAGIFFTQSVTAIGAFMLSALSFTFLVRAKGVRIAVAAIVLLVIASVLAYGPSRERLLHMREFLRGGQLMELTSYRPPAVMVALDLFRERPLLGAGPGNYEAHYMSYKLRVDERFPQWIRPMNANFGEAHNDHVQLLAETGLPGYLLYLAALASVASISFRRHGTSQRAEFARVFALPATIGFAVVGLAQFPLYLTSVAATSLFAFTLARVWSFDEGD